MRAETVRVRANRYIVYAVYTLGEDRWDTFGDRDTPPCEPEQNAVATQALTAILVGGEFLVHAAGGADLGRYRGRTDSSLTDSSDYTSMDEVVRDLWSDFLPDEMTIHTAHAATQFAACVALA